MISFILHKPSQRRAGLNLVCFEGPLTKILKQRLDKTGAVAIETAVHVDI